MDTGRDASDSDMGMVQFKVGVRTGEKINVDSPKNPRNWMEEYATKIWMGIN